jgi:hypothetical protein
MGYRCHVEFAEAIRELPVPEVWGSASTAPSIKPE